MHLTLRVSFILIFVYHLVYANGSLSKCTDEREDCQRRATIYKCRKVSIFFRKCKHACGKCSGCYDQHEKCAKWANSGRCIEKPIYMHYFCRVSCDKCHVEECKDKREDCQSRANIYKCRKVSSFFRKCKHTCGKCTGCYDQHEKCTEWAKRGRCTENPVDMHYFCRVSCGKCPVEDFDECKGTDSICEDNANCINTVGSYICSCKEGFFGYDNKCLDLDECCTSLHDCDVNANCQNTPGSYHCSCKNGFSGDGKTCTDVDECATGSHKCDVNAFCTNTPGRYHCTCKSPYTGNGKNCKLEQTEDKENNKLTCN